MSYNLTQLQQSLTFVDLLDYIYVSTGGIFMGLMLLAVFFILLFALKRYEFDDALFASSLICTLLGIILLSTKLISLVYVLGFGVTLAFTGLYQFLTKR